MEGCYERGAFLFSEVFFSSIRSIDVIDSRVGFWLRFRRDFGEGLVSESVERRLGVVEVWGVRRREDGRGCVLGLDVSMCL